MKRLRGPWSLSTRLTLLVGVLAIPVLLIIGLSYADQVRERRASELDTATRSASNGASIVDGFLRDLENTTIAMAGVLAGSSRPYDQANFGALLGSLAKAYPEVRAIFITDSNGKVVASGTGEGIGVDLSSRSYVATLKGGAERVWSGSIAGLQTGDITVAFGRPIRGLDGPTRGFVITRSTRNACCKRSAWTSRPTRSSRSSTSAAGSYTPPIAGNPRRRRSISSTLLVSATRCKEKSCPSTASRHR